MRTMKKWLLLLCVCGVLFVPMRVLAAFDQEVADVFDDVTEADWFVDYVQEVYDNKIMTGMDDTHFGPSLNLCRAQFAVILYRMEGMPEVAYEERFPDVPEGTFYTDAVLWASSADVGVIKGYESGVMQGCFGPNDNITREQIAVMLHRYTKYKGYQMPEAEGAMDKFTDHVQVNTFANEAMAWAVAEGIITGRTDHILAPLDHAVRAEIAAMICRYQILMERWEEERIPGISFADGYRMEFCQNQDQTIGIQILNAEKECVFENETPAELDITKAESQDVLRYQMGYDEINKDGDRWIADAIVTTEQGNVLEIADIYYSSGEGIRIEREISSKSVEREGYGYASRWTMGASDKESSVDDYEYFIPALLYKDAVNLTSSAVFSSLPAEGAETFVKETRTGLPMVMMREKESGSVISVGHVAEGIEDAAAVEKQYATYRCDADCQYGAVGIGSESGAEVTFRYPFAETPYSYTTGRKGQMCYHPIQSGQKQSYTLYLFATEAEDYNEAMTLSYLSHFEDLDPVTASIDLDEMYETALEDMLAYVQVRGSGIGLPFAVYVDDGSVFIDGSGNEAVNFQMGFIGMQIPLAYQMMRYGEVEGSDEAWEKGVSIVDFWSQRCATDSGVVKVWFDTFDFRPYPAFLRIMTDGMEGMLDAWMLAEQSENYEAGETDAWVNVVCDYADFLVEAQNADGSFYRAYDYSGNAFSDANADGLVGDANTQGNSKMNSAIPIRFLIRMYETFGKEAYLEAARKAGEYVLKELYPQGKYVGGTPDNPNTVDKEAGMYAVYAYSALYSATGEEKYLDAMEQAAVYTFSWTYTYKFRAANPKNLVAGIPTSMGLNDGLSVIATGHSGVDNMIAYMYYELFKLYVWTGDVTYADMALYIQNNSRQTMDLNGTYGYAKRSFMIEATGVADMVFGTAGDRGIWLPWITSANIEPATNMEDTFGTKDVSRALLQSDDKLRNQLQIYGAGGAK